MTYFNPRTRVECDRDAQSDDDRDCYFNPRTRVECDLKIMRDADIYTNFNPRTRVECDVHSFFISPFKPVFQSTHSCRVRRVAGREKTAAQAISIHALV